MGMTMVEKIIAAHTEYESVKPGQIVNARVDMILVMMLLPLWP